MTQAKVSIIVPIYGVEKYIHECVDSILVQTLKEIEIILVDDGSKDNCPAIVDEYAKKDSRVIAIHQENGGYGKAVNHGLKVATGEYIGIVESDDFIEPNMFEELYELAKSNNVEVVKSDFYKYYSDKGDEKANTIPKDDAVNAVRNGLNPTFTARDKHLRECFVVALDGADKEKIENEIKTMPNYFADYDTIVHFISEEELKKNHSALAHGGFVIRSGNMSEDNGAILELGLKLGSNPEFTGSVLTAYARAVAKLSKEGKKGIVTVFDVPLKYLSPKSPEELIKGLL